MTKYHSRIPLHIRQRMTVCPPPEYDGEGNVMPYPDDTLQGYDDQRRAKEKFGPVFIDEELDNYVHPGTTTQYRMMIRRLPSREDLELIMLAARHMGLVDEFYIVLTRRDGLASELESTYIDVSYSTATVKYEDGWRYSQAERHPTKLDSDTRGEIPVVIDYWMRRRIWTELFLAAGYKVVWGNRVLNIKHRQQLS